MNDKITASQLERTAIVYVRQSSMTQVRNNHKSRRMQYAMKSKLIDLGWPARRIEVIDDDLGVTANGARHRNGFEQLMLKVAYGDVGLVAAREVSRFARNSADWQRLLELCRQSDTMLLDHETVYDVRRPNDCLLLGIKGSISSYELELFRARAQTAIRERAARGEHVTGLPVGFAKSFDGRVEKTPDTRVREAVELVFAKFRELGSAWKVTRWFMASGMNLPARRGGGLVEWKPARYGRVISILTNPCYAGVYAYGRVRTIREVVDERARERRKRFLDPQQWPVRLENRHEGYITFTEFEKNRRMLHENKQSHAAVRGAGGAAKNGLGLFTGLLRCGRCGRLLNIYYSSHGDCMRYYCYRGEGMGEPPCGFKMSGEQVDPLLERAVLEAMQPSAVEAAERAWQKYASKVDVRERALKREWEQARYEAQRAHRQYDAIEPENRLVAAELERRWNHALSAASEAEARLTEYRRGMTQGDKTHEDFLALAAAFAEIWRAPETDMALKKRIVRTLIEEVAVAEAPETNEICLRVHWRGGSHSEHRFVRRTTGHTRRTIPENAEKAIVELSLMCDDRMIAKYLNENGALTGDGRSWTGERVMRTRRDRRIRQFDPERRQREGLLTLNEAARELGISHDALQSLAHRGEVAHRHPLESGPYIFRRADIAGQRGDRLRMIVKMRRKTKSPANVEPGRLFAGLEEISSGGE